MLNDSLDYLYLVLIAGKFYEPELVDIWELDADWDSKLRKFDPEVFAIREIEICRKLGWNLYWRKGPPPMKTRGK